MRHELRDELTGPVLNNSMRISALEQWQQRIIGAVTVLTLLVMAGGLGVVVQYFHR